MRGIPSTCLGLGCAFLEGIPCLAVLEERRRYSYKPFLRFASFIRESQNIPKGFNPGGVLSSIPKRVSFHMSHFLISLASSFGGPPQKEANKQTITTSDGVSHCPDCPDLFEVLEVLQGSATKGEDPVGLVRVRLQRPVPVGRINGPWPSRARHPQLACQARPQKQNRPAAEMNMGTRLFVFCSPAKSLTFSGLMENQLVGKKLKS